MYLPLNFIPIIGTFIFLLVQGKYPLVRGTSVVQSNTNSIQGAAEAGWHTSV